MMELIKVGAKIVDGLLVHDQAIACTRCGQGYQLHYSHAEQKLRTRLTDAQLAVDRSHPLHPDSLALPFYWAASRG